MAESFDLVLRNGQVMTPSGLVRTDIGIVDGRIEEIGDLGHAKTAQTIDCTSLHILPGFIDSQVHFREPGMEHKEDLGTGMLAAIAGGVTSIFEMPNTNPLTTTPEQLDYKMNRAAQNPWCDYAFYFGGTANNASQLHEWENLHGVCGVKIFMGSSTGDLLSATDEDVRAVLSNGRRVVAVHAEDELVLRENFNTILGSSTDVQMHPVWRSPAQCLSATNRVIRLARECNRRVHVLHISTWQELESLKDARDVATCEVLPNHLTLSAPECYERLGTYAQQNPPIREQEHQDALWRAVNDGLIDILGSDHAPHTREEKNGTYPKTPSGTPGVQTLMPIMLNHVNNGRLTLERLVDMCCYGPNRVHQIAYKGRIARGYDADFTIIDLKARKTITNAQQKSKCGWTPYDGMQVTGWPVMTVIRGNVVMRDDEIAPTPVGKPVIFREISTAGTR